MINFIFLFFLALISFGVGNKVIKLFKYRFDGFLEGLIFSIGLGLGIVSYLVFLLAAVGLLYRWSCFLLLVLLLPIALWNVWKAGNISFIKQKLRRIRQLRNLSFFEYSLLAILFIYILLCLLSSLAPPIDWDSLVCHLSIPKLWIKNHRAIHIPHIIASEYHLATENLYVLGMILASDITACMIIWLYSLLITLAVFAFCRKYFSAKVGILAASALYCTPLFSAISSRPMVDISTAYYSFLGFYAFFVYLKSDNRKMLLLGSVMSGLAAACKHLGAIPFMVLFILVTIVEIKRRKSLITSFKYIILFGFVFLLVLTPWFAKSYVYTGKIINTWHPGALALLGQKDLKILTGYEKILKYGYKLLRFLLIDYVFERSASKTLWSPGIFIMAFVPCLVFLKNVDKKIKYALIYSIMIILFQAVISQKFRFIRYMAPALIWLFICGSYTAYRLMKEFKALNKIIQVLIILSVSFNIIPIAKWTYQSLPVTFGMETKEDYIDRRIRIYSVIDYANKNLDENAKIFITDRRGYYFDKPYVTKTVIFDNPLAAKYKINDADEDIPRLLRKLKQKGVTHLFCNGNYPNTSFEIMPEELKEYMKLVYSKGRVSLYEFVFPTNSKEG